VKAASERFIDSLPRLQRPEAPLLPTTAEMSRRMPPIKIFSVAAVHKAVKSRAELGRPSHEVGKARRTSITLAQPARSSATE
jgi:hypothetical protein